MDILDEGLGQLVGWHDPDDNRKWVLENKPRHLVDKRMSVTEAVRRYVNDGDLLASGGFGHVRIAMSAIYEIIRQGKRNLVMAGKTGVQDSDLLIASGCVDRIEVAYAFGHELRGLSPASRRKVEGGECQVLGEISNAGYQWRFLAAMMGVPFLPARTMLGTDTLRHSSAKVARDPWSGKLLCLLPACYPDVALIHVSRCDPYGNAQVDGTMIEDFELARASRRLILTAEEIISEEEVRRQPWRTVIPYFLVDAVVEAPYGAHPCTMPYRYYFDEDHIREWLTVSKTAQGAEEYFQKYVYGVTDFSEYLELIGGQRRLQELERIEKLQPAEGG
ncbi:MAG: 3-oxoacid CoA-transferase [Chloroflexi bacterium RBG_16_54_18]|nr:MAG: 3-oxoacid CoA-transferase [Chloroflexi bacterium RBG_16_54_18]